MRDFCENMADGYELMLPLDADSLMTGHAIARLTDAAPQQPGDGAFVGSLRYAAPEQLHRAPLSIATDVFALGVLLLVAWRLVRGGRRGG